MQTTLTNPYEMKEKIKVAIHLAGIIAACALVVMGLILTMWIADSLGIPM